MPLLPGKRVRNPRDSRNLQRQMRILILEDDPNRIAKFRQNFIGCTLDITKDPAQANAWLEENEYYYIFLDHDLEDSHYVEDCLSKETTGLCTATFLGQRPDLQKNAMIIVHSLNPAGSERMIQALDRACRRVPFFNLFK